MIINIIKIIFQERKYIFLLSIISISFLAIFIAIPVLTIPGNDLWFQLSLYSWQNYFLMVFLSLLIGFNFVLQFYSRRERKLRHNFSSSASGVSGILASIIGTASCASCAAPLFAFLGLGLSGTLFLLKYQNYFLIIAIIIMLLAVYISLVNWKKCKICEIKK